MKSQDTFFPHNNFVGREVESLQEVVAGLAAGMDFADQDGAGFTYDTWHDADDDRDEDYTTKPTQDEVFDRIRERFSEGGCKVYMGMFLAAGKFEVVEYKKICLQTDFYIGQTVYLMRDNKIESGVIQHIWLHQGFKDTGKMKEPVDFARDFYNYVRGILLSDGFTYSSLSEPLRYNLERMFLNIAVRGCDMVLVKFRDGKTYLYSISEVFEDKEKLAKHLINEQGG